MSPFKNIAFKTEGPKLQLRFGPFNMFNHTQINGIDAGTNDGVPLGQLTSTHDVCSWRRAEF